jgi:hypothetical protein
MTDLWFPDVRLKQVSPKLVDATARFTSPLSGTLRTVSRLGSRWGVRLDFANLAYGPDRARLETIIAAMQGAANRALWSPSVDFPLRGSFPCPELLSNNLFANGSTGWASYFGETLTAADRAMSVTRTQNDASHGTGFLPSAPLTTLVQYAPYVARFCWTPGRGNYGAFSSVRAGITAGNSELGSAQYSDGRGIATLAFVPYSVANVYPSFFAGDAILGSLAGDYFNTNFTSLARCALVDGGPNGLIYSDDLTQAVAWTGNNATATYGATAPDGNATASRLLENTTNASHYFSNSIGGYPSAPTDVAFSIYLLAGTRSWAWVEMTEATGGTLVATYINLSTGALGSTPSTGANWSNLRSFVEPMGGGWYRCTIVARKTNAATTYSVLVGSATGDNAGVYAGVASANAINTWRAQFSVSSVPVQPQQTGAAQGFAVPQSGVVCRVKGLPANQIGLLLPGDWFEINQELKRCTARLDSDAAGKGMLQFSPPLRNPATDNTPVVINYPMGRFVFANTEVGWASVPPRFSTSSIDLIEAPQ